MNAATSESTPCAGIAQITDHDLASRFVHGVFPEVMLFESFIYFFKWEVPMSDFELNIFVIEIFLFILTHSTIVSFIQKLFFTFYWLFL